MDEPLRTPFPAPAPDAGIKHPRRRAFFAGLGYFGIFLLMQVVVAGQIAILLSVHTMLTVGLNDYTALYDALTQAVQNHAALITGVCDGVALLTVFFLLRAKKRPFFAACGLTRLALKPLFVLVPLGVAANLLVSLVLSLLPQDVLAGYSQSAGYVAGATDLVSFLIVAVFAPFVEEVFFRGLIYTRFREAMPRWPAILLQALLFGVMHGHPVWIAYAFGLGVLLALLRDRYKTLLAPVALHIAFNASSYLLLALADLSAGALIIAAALLLAAAVLGLRTETRGGAA